jgi:hypothetical protein
MEEVTMLKEGNLIIRKMVDDDLEELRNIFLEVRQKEFNWEEPSEIMSVYFDKSTEA